MCEIRNLTRPQRAHALKAQSPYRKAAVYVCEKEKVTHFFSFRSAVGWSKE
jgi:hypothetical protein